MIPLDEGSHVTADGTKLLFWRWQGGLSPAFLLIHGLASNARLWDGVAGYLSQMGFRSVEVDLRGHGQSDKPALGYDFATIAGDLAGLISSEMRAPVVVVGQSYGGDVALELASRFPQLVAGLVCIDGGFIDLAIQFGHDWSDCLATLTPPPLDDLSAEAVWHAAIERYPGWSEQAISAQLANLEKYDVGGLRRRLPLEHHVTILRHMFEQDPLSVAASIPHPVLVIAANDDLRLGKVREVEAFVARLQRGRVEWINGHHDLHAQKPERVAEVILAAEAEGFFR